VVSVWCVCVRCGVVCVVVCGVGQVCCGVVVGVGVCGGEKQSSVRKSRPNAEKRENACARQEAWREKKVTEKARGDLPENRYNAGRGRGRGEIQRRAGSRR